MNRMNKVTASVNFDPVWMPRIAPDPRGDAADLLEQAGRSSVLEDSIVCELEKNGYSILELAGKINAEFGSTKPSGVKSSNLPHLVPCRRRVPSCLNPSFLSTRPDAGLREK